MMAGEIVWPFDANGKEEIVEEYGYATEVLESRFGEQRVKLRRHPIGSIEFSYRAATEWEAQTVGPLLMAHQGKAWLVPLWHFACVLTADVAAGSTVLPCDTASVPFLDPIGGGTQAILWRGFRDFEVVDLQAVGGGVTVATGISGTYVAGTAWVIPVRVGRMDEVMPKTWESANVAAGRVRFSFDHLPDQAVGPIGAGYAFSGEGLVGTVP